MQIISVPDIQNPVWRELVTGKREHQFKFLAAGMCFSRNIREVNKNPADEAVIQQAIAEVQSFCTKYRPLLKNDLAVLFPPATFPPVQEAALNG